jgi:hypothetical protein
MQYLPTCVGHTLSPALRWDLVALAQARDWLLSE